MSQEEITIIIPNYKTPYLTKLCLRSIRKHTDMNRVRVIVVDNDSADESLEYLKTVDWITLVERKTAGESGPEMHARALDQAMTMVQTPLVMVIHTDTIVIHDQWLDFLLKKLNEDPSNGGVGSWKMEVVSPLKVFGKKIEDVFRRLLRRNVKKERKYFRSHCALYKTDLVRTHSHGFHDGGTVGHSLFDSLVAAGFRMPFIDGAELGNYIRHLNHATMILNPADNDRRTASPKARKKLEAKLAELGCTEIMQDDSLDHR